MSWMWTFAVLPSYKLLCLIFFLVVFTDEEDLGNIALLSGEGKKGTSAIKSPLTSKLITSIQSSFTLLVQWLSLCVNTTNEIQEMQRWLLFSDGFPYLP